MNSLVLGQTHLPNFFVMNHQKNLQGLICLFVIVLSSCKEDFPVNANKTNFKIPVVIQKKTDDTIGYFKAISISDAHNRYEGKRKFCDTLDINISRHKDSLEKSDYVSGRDVWRADTFGYDGLELFPDYSSTIIRDDLLHEQLKNYYPVYIVNQTPNVKFILGKDSHVFAIQEAVDTAGHWRPIEGRGFDFCGFGYWGVKIHPQEFVTILMPRYEGEFTTKLRVRVKIGNMIYISKSFTGKIDERQFYIDEDDYFFSEFKRDNVNTIQHIFYGAIPAQMDNADSELHALITQ